MTAIGIFGSAGRMGQAIAVAMPDLGGTFAGGGDAGDDPAPLAARADVLVDFSVPSALAAHLAAAVAARTPIVIGTTGLSHAHHAAIDEAAREIAVLQTGNTSLGVTLLSILVRDAAARLGPDWDIEIVEMHHRHKVDAPSGTALMLGQAAADGRKIALKDHSVRSRDGHTGARNRGDIGFATLRGGNVVGEHSVVFAADGERVVLSHIATDRGIFARGAVKAALWARGKGPGLFGMSDVLGM